ncbi:AMP-binding enzyme [Mycolicibacterium elephantis]
MRSRPLSSGHVAPPLIEPRVIITGGRRVYSGEVEQAIAGHPDVDDVAVVGRPDDVWGETVVAVVTARAPGSSSTLADFKVPREVIFGAVPRNGAGKGAEAPTATRSER